MQPNHFSAAKTQLKILHAFRIERHLVGGEHYNTAYVGGMLPNVKNKKTPKRFNFYR